MSPPLRVSLTTLASSLQPEKKVSKAEPEDEIIEDEEPAHIDEGGADFDLESDELKERCVGGEGIKRRGMLAVAQADALALAASRSCA